MADIAVLDIKVQTAQVKAAQAELNGLSNSGNKAETTVEKLTQAGRRLAAEYYALQGVVQGVKEGFVAVMQAGMRMERLGMSMTAITGSAKSAKDALEFVRMQSDKAGVSFVDTAAAFKSLLAAGSASGMAEKDIRSLFSAVVEAGAVVGMTGEQQARSLLALEQMISKGVVSTEELRRQLGDSLPGAFATAAKAMGVTTMQLDKMLEKGEVISKEFLPKFAKQLKDDFGGSIEDAGTTGTAALGRLSSAWEVFKAGFYDAPQIVSAINSIAGALNMLGGAGLGFSGPKGGEDSLDDMRKQLVGLRKEREAWSGFQSDAPLLDFILGTPQTQEKINELDRQIGTIDRRLLQGQIALGKGAVDLSRPKTEKQLIEERAQGLMFLDRQKKSNIGADRDSASAIDAANQARLDAIKSIQEANEETSRSTASIYAEIGALNEVSGLYGDAYSDKLSMLNAAIRAQEEYTDSVNRGVFADIAAAKQAATLAKAQRDIDERKSQGAKGVAGGFAGGAYDAQVAQIKEQYALASQYTADRVALERAMNQKLTQIEIARLRATGNAYDGMKAAAMDYAESATNAGQNAANAFTSIMSSLENTLTDFVATGKASFSDLATSIIKDIIRIQVRATLGSVASSIASGGIFSGITGLFGFNHGGGMVGSPTFSRQVPLAAFAGAERFHDGGWPGLKSDEVPIIAQKGERVLSRQEVAAGGNGGTQTVTVIMKDAKGNQTAAPMSFNTNGMREFILNVVRDGSERGLLGAT